MWGSTSRSSSWTMPARTYDFVSGPAHFFALDSNDMMWAEYFDEAKDRNQQIIAGHVTIGLGIAVAATGAILLLLE